MDIEKESGKKQTVKCNTGDALMSKEKQQKSKSKGNQQGQSKENSKKTFRCHNCDGIGHFARDCPSEKSFKGLKKGNNKESSTSHDVKEAFVSAQNDDDSECWMADSAAYRYITRRKEWFTEMEPLNPPERVRIGDDKYVNAIAKGTIDIWVYDGHKWQAKILKEVRYCPNFGSANLFSTGAAAQLGHKALFHNDGMNIIGPDGNVRIIGVKKSPTTYKLMIKPRISGEAQSVQEEQADWRLWHQRLDHACLKQVKAVLRSKGITATGNEKILL